MATNGSLTTTGGFENRNLIFSWTATAQSAESNTTIIDWTLKGTGGDSTYYYMSAPFTVKINGATVYTSSTRIKLKTTTTVASGTYTVVHDDAGDATLSVSVEAAIYYNAVNSTGSASWNLENIPRASVPTLGAGTIELGKSVSIYTNAKSSRFRHKLFYNWYSRDNGQPVWITIALGVTDEWLWTLPLTFANNLPGTTQGVGTIRCETWDGDTMIGTKDVSFTGVVPNTAEFYPSVSISVTDPTGYQDTYGALVQGVSLMSVNLNSTLAYKSPITNTMAFANGVAYGTTTFLTDAVRDSGTIDIVAQVTDERGRSSDVAQLDLEVLPYQRPTVSALSVHRCNEDGTENDQGEYVQVTFSAKVYDLNGQNSAKYTLEYTPNGGTTQTEELTDLQGTYLLNNYSLPPFAADGSLTYEVKIIAEDDIDEGNRTTSVSTAFTMMNWSEGGTGMGIGKVAEKENTLQVGLDFEAKGPATFEGDTNLTGPVNLPKGTLADYVIETGTEAMGSDGTWHWTKWANGKAECYGCRNYGNMAVNHPWDNSSGFLSAAFTQTFPSGLFATAPEFCDITVNKTSDALIPMIGGGDISAESTGAFYLLRLAEAVTASQVYLGFHAIGRWK